MRRKNRNSLWLTLLILGTVGAIAAARIYWSYKTDIARPPAQQEAAVSVERANEGLAAAVRERK